MALLRQTSFAAGELSPLLWGRTDLELYAHGARRINNWVVTPQGNLVTRPGSQLAWTAKANVVRLLPFLHLSGESYVLEFSHLAVRIYNARTLALFAELVTPFQQGDLDELQWAQVGSVLVVCHAQRQPQEITIASVATIYPLRTSPPGDNPGDAAMSGVYPSIGGNPPADPVLAQWQPGTLFALDAEHPPREWRYQVSQVVQHLLTGEKAETLPRTLSKYASGDVANGSVSAPAFPLVDNQLVLYPDAPIYIEPGLGDAVAQPSWWVALENLYYRGRGTMYGLVGRAAPNVRFADFGVDPDWEYPPLRGESPFPSGSWPAAVAFFQQRRCFGGPLSTWWASAVDEWRNHDKPVVPYPGQPLEATLVGKRREAIVAMAQLEHLFVFTDTSVWQVGRDDVPLDYDTLPSVCRLVDEVGCRALQPLVVGDALLWVRARGRGVRALARNDVGGFSPRDITWQAEHLFRGATQSPTGGMEGMHLKAWCHQRDPWDTIWAVRSDGRLLTCTRTGTGTWAWARHDVGGQVVSVTAVPRLEVAGGQGGWDEVFIAVQRGGATRIERAVPQEVRGIPRYVTDEAYAGLAIGEHLLTYPLDSYVLATVTKATGTTVAGLGHLEGLEVWGSCPGIEDRQLGTVVGGQVTTPAGWGPTGATTFKAAIGLRYECDVELLDAAPARTNQKTVVKVGFEVDNAVGLEVGEDESHLVPWRQRNVDDGYDFPSAASALVVVAVKGAWRRSGRAYLRQTRPQPCTLLGVTREVDVGGS